LQEGRQGLIDAPDPRLALFGRGAATHGQDPRGTESAAENGSFFPIEISSVVFRSPEGDARTGIIIRDITERRAAETERERLIQEL